MASPRYEQNSPYLQLPSRPAVAALGSTAGLLRPGSGDGSSSGPGLGLGSWLSADPRTASTQSLTPSDFGSEPEPEASGPVSSSSPKTPPRRRTLLLVYIHGFYGNAQSFKSFPAHVHGFLKALLADTHVIHSKIYPRYKCYRAIEVARDNFSAWLEPHTSPHTDVVLVGHSMGGLLAAEVVLMPNQSPYVRHPFKHRILGSISLDSPFLGLHPGIIVSGLSSLFQPAQSPPAVENGVGAVPTSTNASTMTLGTDGSGQSFVSTGPLSPPPRQPTDPFFDPPYFNDAPFKEQPFLKRLWNFASKHQSEGIWRAVRNHVTSHLEFASCLADYPGLSARYNKVRALEDIDEVLYVSQGHPRGAHARVRFVNYYTLSPGRPSPPPTPKSPGATNQTVEASPRSSADSTHPVVDGTATTSDIKKDNSTGLREEESESDQDTGSQAELTVLAPQPIEEEDLGERASLDKQLQQGLGNLASGSSQDIQDTAAGLSQASTTVATQGSSIVTATDEPLSTGDPGSFLALPPLPDPPTEPVLPDPEQYVDKDARKQVEKERKRLQKAYEKALKDHAKAVREREKLLQKAEKEAAKARQKQQRAQAQKAEKAERAERTEMAAMVEQAEPPSPVLEAVKPKKQRKFCRLPSKQDGALDPAWVDIYIDGVDEVGAHCGLFVPGPHYDKLVGDVGSRILGWVQDDLTKRAILDMAP